MRIFVDECSDGCKDIPFLNITDEGHQCVLMAWHAGKQLLLQPSFAYNDKHFGTKEVLCSTMVASHPSINENVTKYSGLVQRGLVQREDPAEVANSWLVWGFQCNFYSSFNSLYIEQSVAHSLSIFFKIVKIASL